MNYRVDFSPEAQDQLIDLYRYLAEFAAPEIADRYTDEIVTYCEELAVFPQRGTARDDIRPGLRITTIKKRTVIAFAVLGRTITIVGVFSGRRDYETFLRG